MGRTPRSGKHRGSSSLVQETEVDPPVVLNDMAAVQHGLNGAASEVSYLTPSNRYPCRILLPKHNPPPPPRLPVRPCAEEVVHLLADITFVVS